jgi:predicted RNA-binding Zn-ribbon protein involved in translation (DUF1610 family)
MLRVIQICEKCNEQNLSSDDIGGELIIDYYKKIFQFICPKCGNVNVFDFGDIKKALERRTKLPLIGHF